MVDSGDVSSAGESALVSVETDDIVQGCVKWLESKSDLTVMLGEFEEFPNQYYLFQYEMGVVLEGTQKAAVVVDQMGSWASPNVHNSMKFPRLKIEIWVDPIRDPERNFVNRSETRRRMNAIYNTVDRYLHRPQGGEQIWGTVRTVDCTRLGEPVIYPVGDGDAMLRGQVFYGCSVG